MGGAADLPQRSSSPLKRPASELDAEIPSSQRDDVDMIVVPSVEPTVEVGDSAHSVQTEDDSVDMLQNDGLENGAGGVENEGTGSTVAKPAETISAETGIFIIFYFIHEIY